MSDRWPVTLSDHADRCASCRDLKRVIEALQHPLRPATPAVDASALWVCGRHARRIGLEARISTIVALTQIGAIVGVVAMLVAWIGWPDLQAAIVALRPEGPYVWVGVATTIVALAAWWVVANARGRSPA
jgi:hypothetical protein